MMDFIWHLRGSISLNGIASSDSVLGSVEQLLDRQRKDTIERRSNFLTFDDPIWSNSFSPNWLAMVIYDRGRFWIEQGRDGRKLRYDLRSLHGMVFCLLAAFAALLFGILGGSLFTGLKLAVAAFAWLYGMNVLTARVRVPRAIRQALARDDLLDGNRAR